MAARKTIFLSDLHIGMQVFTDAEAFTASHIEPLCALLTYFSTQSEQIKDLVLLGDVLDNWMCPVNRALVKPEDAKRIPSWMTFPPRMADIIKAKANQPIWEALRACVDTLEGVYYSRGNHDLETTQADLDLILPKDSSKRIKLIDRYLDGLLVAQHGHQGAMFNAPDPIHDPFNHLPLGYFITRLVATCEDSHKSFKAVVSYIDDIFKAVGPSETFSTSVINALMDHAGLDDSTVVEMDPKRPDLTLAEVKHKYAKLYEVWASQGPLSAFWAVEAELGMLGAQVAALHETFKLVVMGHTHTPALKVYPRIAKDDPAWPIRQLYANAGKICTKSPTFVEVENQPHGKWRVRLIKVDYDKRIAAERLKFRVLEDRSLQA